MTENQASQLITLLKAKGVSFDKGLTDDKIQEIEIKFSFVFPTDLQAFLRTALPSSRGFPHWRLALANKKESQKISSLLAAPHEGVLFDVQHNNFWFADWGIRPALIADKIEVAKQYLATYPTLIPLFSHRYISSFPTGSDNPVFSVYQTDIIYYGYTLATYLANEFHLKLPAGFNKPGEALIHSEFWSDVAG